MSSCNCCFLTCIQVSQEAGQVVWYSHLFKNVPQFVVIHTVKGFGVVNKAEVDVFLELSCFFSDPVDVGNLISGSSAFSGSSLNIWKLMVCVLLKPGLENFEHYFANVRSGFYSKERGVGWGGLNRRDMPVLGYSKTPLSSRGGSTVRGEDWSREGGRQVLREVMMACRAQMIRSQAGRGFGGSRCRERETVSPRIFTWSTRMVIEHKNFSLGIHKCLLENLWSK